MSITLVKLPTEGGEPVYVNPAQIREVYQDEHKRVIIHFELQHRVFVKGLTLNNVIILLKNGVF